MTLLSRALTTSFFILVFSMSILAAPLTSHALDIVQNSQGNFVPRTCGFGDFFALLRGDCQQASLFGSANAAPAASAPAPVYSGPAYPNQSAPGAPADQIINAVSAPAPVSAPAQPWGAASAKVPNSDYYYGSAVPSRLDPNSPYFEFPYTPQPQSAPVPTANAPQPVSQWDKDNNATVNAWQNYASHINDLPYGGVQDFGNEKPLPIEQTIAPAPVQNTPIPSGTFVPELDCYVDQSGTCMGPAGWQNTWEKDIPYSSPSPSGQQGVTDASGGYTNLYTGEQSYDSFLAQTPTPSGPPSSGNFFTDIGNLFSSIFGGGSSQQSAPPVVPSTPPSNAVTPTMYTDNTGALYNNTGALVSQPTDQPWGVNPRNDIGSVSYPAGTALPDTIAQPAQEQTSWWSGVSEDISDWWSGLF